MENPNQINTEITAIDNWKELKANETAKRAIEIAVAGGHEIHFSPVEGHALRWARYDVERLQGVHRESAQWWAAQFPDENAMSIDAAYRQAANCATAMHYLAEGCGLPCPSWRPDQAASKTCVISVDVSPISLADYLLPPPAEPMVPVVARIAAARARRDKVGPMDYRAAELMKQFARYVPIDDATAGRIIQVARTIEALAYGGDFIGRMALAEAISYYRHPEPSPDRTPTTAQEPVQEVPAPVVVESEAQNLAVQAQQAIEAPTTPPSPEIASNEPEIGQDGAAIAAASTEIAFSAWLTAQFGPWIIAGRQSAKMTEAGKRAITPRQYAKLKVQWERGNIESAPPLVEKPGADQVAALVDLVQSLTARIEALEGVRLDQVSPAPDQLTPKRTRTAAHTRLLMRYLAMRKERERDRSALLAGGDYCRRLSVELEQAKESLANAQAAGTRYRDQRIEADESARDWSRKEEKQRNRADRAERALVEAHTQAEILGKSLREASERALKAETALAAIEARANGWPPAAVSVKSVTFNARHAA